MILSDQEIRDAIKQKLIVIDPRPGDDQFSSSSLDLRLGEVFSRWNPDLVQQTGVTVSVDPSQADYVGLAKRYGSDVQRESDGNFLIRPKEFLLGMTLERIELPVDSSIAARVEGRSSLARMGLLVHLSAPTIHAGWEGQITLELVNMGPFGIKLAPSALRVCQLVFERVGMSPSGPPSTQFLGQRSPTGQ